MYKLYVSAWLNNGKTTWNKHSEYHNTEKDAILFIYSASLDNFPDLAKTALFRGSRDCQSFHTANKRTRKKPNCEMWYKTRTTDVRRCQLIASVFLFNGKIF